MACTAHRAGPAEPVDLDRGDPRGEQGRASAAGVAGHVDRDVEALVTGEVDECGVAGRRAEVDAGECLFDAGPQRIGADIAPEQADGLDPRAVKAFDRFYGELPESRVAQFAGEEADPQRAAGAAHGWRDGGEGRRRREDFGHAAQGGRIVEQGEDHERRGLRGAGGERLAQDGEVFPAPAPVADAGAVGSGLGRSEGAGRGVSEGALGIERGSGKVAEIAADRGAA